MYGFSLSVLIIVAVISFVLGGGAVYVGTTVRSEPAPEQKETEEGFVFTRQEEEKKEEDIATTTEIIVEKEEEAVVKEEPQPKLKPAPGPVAIPKPKSPTPTPPPQPATVLNTVTPSVAPTTITLPNGAVAELDSKGNIVRYISGGPEGGVTTQPQAQTQTTEQGSNTPSVNDFTPQSGNRIVEFPNGSIAEVRPDGSLVKLHYTP